MIEIIQSNNSAVTLSEIGGKAKGLLFLEKHNFRTPPFYILNFETLMAIINGSESLSLLLQNWKIKNNIPLDSIWAIRSSADNEDGIKKSFAGLFATETNVTIDHLENAIQIVLKAYAAVDKLHYNENEKIEFGIILQEMIRAEYSGVIFSHNPLNLNQSTIHINVIPGIGENLVSGKEEACLIVCSGKEIIFQNSSETFNGQVYTDRLIDVSKTGEEIKKGISPLLSELIKGTQQLSKLKKRPVDIEFAIANNTIYWLQIRPITASDLNEITIWDNTQAEGNYPGITLPLSISMVKTSFQYAYISMGEFLGMNKIFISKNEILLKNMCGEIHGGLYYNVTAWQKLMHQLPFGKKASVVLPKMWGMEPADFTPMSYKISLFFRVKILFNLIFSFLFLNQLKKKYLKNYTKVIKDYGEVNFSEKTHKELVVIYNDIQSRLGRNWAAPMLNGFFTMLLFSTLKNITVKSRLNKTYPNFINDILFAQGDVISVTIVREFQKILFKIQQDENLLRLFLNETPLQISQTISTNNKEFEKDLNNYIQHYGERSDEGELKIETINYKEDPLLFISFLKVNSTGKMNVPNPDANKFNYKEIIKKEYPFNLFKRFFLNLLIRNTINKIRDRENYRFIRTKTFGLVRAVFRAIDQDLVNRNLIEFKNDSLYLVLDELTNPESSTLYAGIIRERKAAYEIHTKTIRVNRYRQNKNDFFPVEINELENSKSVISGIGCCSGIIKGEVKIIGNKAEIVEGFSGKILIADYFEPGKINLFSQAAGIISIRGNLLSHTAILCREMGIPSIVGARGLLSKIKDGDIIEMNGGTGKINLISNDE